MILWEIFKALKNCGGFDSAIECVYNIFQEKIFYKEGVIMKTLAEERFAVCQNHPEQQEIFKLEKLLIESGRPYYFNFWEDLRAVFGGAEDGDPESIDWNSYDFLIEVPSDAQMNNGAKIVIVRFSKDVKNLLEVWSCSHIGNDELTPKNISVNASADEVMEIIEKFFEEAK